MKIVVCVRQGRDGELNPFDACAYEAALRVAGADITLLSMGPSKTAALLEQLTRLGAQKAVLLSDRVFAGADTLATAYALSLAVARLQPDLIFCGRQTLEGDTGQVGPMLAEMNGYALLTNVMALEVHDSTVRCDTRDEGTQCAAFPALLTLERINTLRLPSIRSRIGTVTTWDAAAIGADVARCGLTGSPTRVLESHENAAGRRRCTFISPAELPTVIAGAKEKRHEAVAPVAVTNKLQKVLIVGEAPRVFAETVADTVEMLHPGTAATLAAAIAQTDAAAVLWGTDSVSKRTAAQVAARLRLGLCADCTALDTDGENLLMIRPALSGTVIAKIRSLTRPAMATVRTTVAAQDIVVAAGYGVKNDIPQVKAFAQRLGAELGASRRLVDDGVLPYAAQVGLTGRTVAPPVYIAVGISGAVHHIVGMQQAGTVIAVNPDRKAPIFDYADYGIVAEFSDVFKSEA